MEIVVPIKTQRIVDLLCTAIESGVGYWVTEITQIKGKDAVEKPWYSCPTIFDDELVLKVVYDDPDKEEGNGAASKEITMKDIHKGFEIMAVKESGHFADFINENEDATTADVWWQCVVLGETVYG